MKILIFSDSHGDSYAIRGALHKHPDADAAIFLGDGVTDFLEAREDFPRIDFYAVRGNCDPSVRLASLGESFPEETVLQFGGLRFFCLHGHTRNIKFSYTSMLLRAAELRADAVLFGHTHTPENTSAADPADSEKRILLFNPGSVGRGSSPTYGVLYAVNGVISASHGRAIENQTAVGCL